MDDERREPWEQDEAEIGGDVRSWGEETFGDPEPGPVYRCPDHGLIYAGDVVWGRDGKPYCPKVGCNKPCERVD